MYNSREPRTTTEFYTEAVDVNRQVTSGLRNALKTVGDSLEVQSSTLEELAKQREQLGKVQKDLVDVEEDTKYAGSVLNDIGSRFWFLKFYKTWKPRKTRTRTGLPPSPSNSTKFDLIKKKMKSGKFYHRPNDISENTVDNEAVAEINEGRKEQDDLLDQISSGVDILKLGAQSIATELNTQDQILNQTQIQAETTLQETKKTTRHRTFTKYACRR